MSFNKILFFFILFNVNNSKNFPLVTNIMIENATSSKKECSGKIPQERQPLFVKGEQYEQNFIKAYTQCLEENDCDISKQFQEAKRDVENFLLILKNYLKELETKNDAPCHVCEKTEGKDLKNRLIQLLKTASQK